MTYRSQFIQEAQRRGMLNQATDLNALDDHLSEGMVTAYIGFDATAPSLHVGSLMQIMVLRLLQQCGHRPIVVMGGGTTKVGDPSFKDSARPMITDEIIEENLRGIQKVFSKYLTFGNGPTDAIMVNNDDWLKNLNYMDFLRDYGKHFSINRMLSFDSVKIRLDREQSLSFLEFNYMILQGYDFLELNRRYGCTLQFGGQDQWGNILNGTELIRRVDSKDAFGMTTPLLTTASGEKMGKTVGGAIWLNEDMLSTFDFWQYWRNRDDSDIEKFLRLFTELSESEIKRLGSLEGAAINEAKVILADEITKLAHGQEAVNQVKEAVSGLYGSGAGTLDAIPQIDFPLEDFKKGMPFFELVRKAGLATSNGEARRLIQGGGVRLNDEPIKDEMSLIQELSLDGEKTLKLSVGKKRFVHIKGV
jgi:tyrosyl-tRNA synthetase